MFDTDVCSGLPAHEQSVVHRVVLTNQLSFVERVVAGIMVYGHEYIMGNGLTLRCPDTIGILE